MESPHTVSRVEGRRATATSMQALLAPASVGTRPARSIAGQLRGNIEFWHKNDRIKVARFFGKVPKHLMPDEDARRRPTERR
jgi:hypothetical protein